MTTQAGAPCRLLRLLILGAVAATAAAMPPDLLEAVPADACVGLVVDPAGSTPRGTTQGTADRPPSALDTAAFLLRQARQMGLTNRVDGQVAAVMDTIASLPVVVRHPFAVCILRAGARRLPDGGYRLSDLHAALIVRTNGRNTALQSRIQQLLNTHVNSEVATIETVRRRTHIGHRLLDRRLPGWAVVEWGPVGNCYIVALGEGTLDAVARCLGASDEQRPSLRDDAWFRAAFARCRGESAAALWTVRFHAIRRGLGLIMTGEPEDVLRGLGLEKTDRGLWSLGFAGRAVEAYSVLHTRPAGGRPPQDLFRPICRAPSGDWIHTVVPPLARQFAVIEHAPRDLVLRARDAYLASRQPSTRAQLRELWSRLETDTDTSVDREVLRQLGDRIVIHDAPPHPLGIPLARTILIEVSGSAAAARTCLERLLVRAQQHLDRPSADWASLRLNRADDGVWYLQAGLCGPALAITDRWIVIGYSPAAVRRNVAFLQESSARIEAPSGPRPTERAEP